MIEGIKVSEMFSLVGKYGKELEALAEGLENLLTDSLGSDKNNLPCIVAGKTEWDFRVDDSGWIHTDCGCSIPLKSRGKGKKKAERHVVFQISMAGDGAKNGKNEEPLLHIGLWDEGVSFGDRDENFMSIPIQENWERPSLIHANRLMYWSGDGSWSDHDWVYSLKLMSINSTDDLRKFVVGPVVALLQGRDVCEALPDEWLDHVLIRYENA